MKLSVIICTHNPREDYLRRTIESLKAQTLPPDQWEFLLVDNLSDQALSSQWDLSWHPGAWHVLEPELGLTPARLRGIKESDGDLLVFVDDDNVLIPEYLERAAGIARQMPWMGVFGAGILMPEFEIVPPPELDPYLGMLALREVRATRWSNRPDDEWVPWGAGMVVRREVAIRHGERLQSSKASQSLDRKAGELNSGGDDEFSWTATAMGLAKGIFPELIITHLIGKGRLSREYFLRLAEGHYYSNGLLRWIHLGTMPEIKTPPSLRTVLSLAFRIRISDFLVQASHYWHRRRSPQWTVEMQDAIARGSQRAAATIRGWTGA